MNSTMTFIAIGLANIVLVGVVCLVLTFEEWMTEHKCFQLFNELITREQQT